MFSRLEYVYCTAECVQKHKRELMAAAALARFGNA
jgi:Vms1-associating treble clef domain